MNEFLTTLAQGFCHLAQATSTSTDVTESSGLVWRILGIFALVIANGFFVAAEFSIVRVRDTQFDPLLEMGPRAASRAGRAQFVARNLDSFLSATQLGVTICSLTLGALIQPFALLVLEPLLSNFISGSATLDTVAFVGALGAVMFLHIILGELMPRTFAVRKSIGTTLLLARPLIWFHRLFLPAIWLFDKVSNFLLTWVFRLEPVSRSETFHSAEELRILVNETEKSDAVTEIEREILINALELSDLFARDVMTPRNEVIWLNLDDDIDANFEKAIDSQHTRLPLCREHLDDAIGLVHVKDLLQISRKKNPDLHSIRRPLELIPEMMPLDRLLKVFLDKKAHMAIVADEYGGSLGIVTLDNVLEELVGDIQDEFDDEETEPAGFVRVDDARFVVTGGLSLHELSDHSELYLENPDVSTIGGYVTHLLGRLPDEGETHEMEGYLVTVSEADGRSIGKLEFERLPDKSDDDDDDNNDGDDSAPEAVEQEEAA